MDSPLAIVAGLTWLAAIYELRNVARHPTAMVTSYWLVLVFVSLAITIRTPAVSEWVDSGASLPHLSRFIANTCGVVALLAAQNAVYTVLVPERQLRVLRWGAISVAAAILLVMAALFARTAPLDDTREAWRAYAVNGMAGYRLTFLAFMGISFLVATVVWVRHAFLGVGTRSRTAFLLIAAGGFIGLLYVLNGYGIVLRAIGRSPVTWWGDQQLTDPLLSVALVSVLVGAAAYLWYGAVDAVRKHRAFLRLRPLWMELTEAYPDVTLLPKRSLVRDLFDIRDADFRLRRQVTEIRDARILLRDDLGKGNEPQTLRALGSDLVNNDPGDLWTEVNKLVQVADDAKGAAAPQSSVAHLGGPTHTKESEVEPDTSHTAVTKRGQGASS